MRRFIVAGAAAFLLLLALVWSFCLSYGTQTDETVPYPPPTPTATR